MIAEFNGQYRFLSNFYPSAVKYLGVVCPTVEHGFQAAKTIQPHEQAWVLSAQSPSEAKKRGRKVAKRPDWDSVRISVMRELLELKFALPSMRERLLDTGNEELVEGNWWGDRFWGVCNGVGDNHLGKLLMEVREQLRESTQATSL